MANRLQHLRGSEAEHSTFTGAKGEISLVTDTSSDRIPTGEVRVHDGTTAGGLPLALGTTSKPLTNNIVLSSGVGINFNNYGSEDSNSATTVGSNLLDVYEEGTWTPTYKTSSTNFTSVNLNTSVTGGKYVKIGNIVYASGNLYTTSITVGSASGTVRIGNLPFNIADNTVAQNGYTALMVGEAQGFAGDVPSRGRGVPLTDVIDLFYKTTSNGNTNSLVPADLGTGANANLLRFTIVYVAS